MSSAPQHGVGGRTLRGMLWAYGSFLSGRLLVLLATAVLARLLTPTDFGLVALALAFIGILDTVSNLGLGQALIVQKDREVYDRAETAFVGSIAASLCLSAAIAACSPLVAAFFDEPALVGIVSALGANFFLRSLGLTHYSLAQRNLDFRARTIAELSDATVRGLVGIGLAIAGFGAWSLVLGYLAGTIALDVAIWRSVSWRPRLRPRREHLRHLLRFGGGVTAINLTAAVSLTVDNLFVGRVLGPAALGFYSLAFRLPQMAVLSMSVVASTVLFPAFSAYDRARLGIAYLVSTRYVWLIALPLAIFLGVLAEPLVLVAFGDQWQDAVEPMRVIAIFCFAYAIGFPAGDAYKATGRVGVVLALTATRLGILVIALVLFVEHGITAVAASQAGSAVIVESAAVVLASRLLAVPLRAIAAETWPAIAATLPMAALVIGIDQAIESAWMTVMLAGPLAAAVYIAVLLLVAPEALRYLRDKLSSRERTESGVPTADATRPP